MFLITILCAWSVGGGLAGAASLGGLFKGGFNGEAWTFDREAFPLQNIDFDTPRDFAREPGSRLYGFTATPDPPDFAVIQEIVRSKMITEWLSSRPEAIEYFRLGDYTAPVPPPPDWRRVFGQIPPWKHPVATANPGRLPFLNQAIFCWADESDETLRRGGSYVFRQSFNIDQPETIARAILRLATNAELVDVSLNEHPLHLAGNRTFLIAEYEATPLLRPRGNILALHVRQRPGAAEIGAGLAFHLELTRRESPTGHPGRLDPTAALALSERGDRVWGRVNDMRGDGIRLTTTFGLYSLNWDDCRGLLFPAGWLASDAPGAPRPPMGILHGLPLTMAPKPLQDCLLLTQGRLTTAKPSYVLDGRLHFEGVEGKQYTLGMDEVLGIYPPRPNSTEFELPEAAVAVLFCRVTTTTGEQLSGLLRELNGRRIVIESSSGAILNFDAGLVASIVFPYHYPRYTVENGAQSTPPTIALLPQLPGQEAYQPTYLADARRVQTAAFALGLPVTTIQPEILADPQRLTPANYPLLVSVDPVGEYLETLNQPGDAAGALAHYISQGGRMIVLSRGGAFRTAVKHEQGTFHRQAGPPDPNASFAASQLALLTIRPADPQPSGIRAFDRPPNSAAEFFFQRQDLLPEGLDSLMRRFPVASMISAPFFPMIGRNGQGTAVYTLADTSGAVYGPALTLLPVGQGYAAIIDHLLWESEAENKTFADGVLPLLMHWALTSGGKR